MKKITVYQKPTCTTCRKVHAALVEAEVDFDAVNYYVDPLNEKQLAALVKKMGIGAQELFRKREDIYKELQLAGKDVSDEEAIALMVKHPDLLQRPIVEQGARAILARPAETITEFLAG